MNAHTIPHAETRAALADARARDPLGPRSYFNGPTPQKEVPMKTSDGYVIERRKGDSPWEVADRRDSIAAARDLQIALEATTDAAWVYRVRETFRPLPAGGYRP